jgi:hypothetical protein
VAGELVTVCGEVRLKPEQPVEGGQPAASGEAFVGTEDPSPVFAGNVVLTGRIREYKIAAMGNQRDEKVGLWMRIRPIEKWPVLAQENIFAQLGANRIRAHLVFYRCHPRYEPQDAAGGRAGSYIAVGREAVTKIF